ncbi:hypothetical protein [Nitratifractor sp.]
MGCDAFVKFGDGEVAIPDELRERFPDIEIEVVSDTTIRIKNVCGADVGFGSEIVPAAEGAFWANVSHGPNVGRIATSYEGDVTGPCPPKLVAFYANADDAPPFLDIRDRRCDIPPMIGMFITAPVLEHFTTDGVTDFDALEQWVYDSLPRDPYGNLETSYGVDAHYAIMSLRSTPQEKINEYLQANADPIAAYNAIVEMADIFYRANPTDSRQINFTFRPCTGGSGGGGAIDASFIGSYNRDEPYIGLRINFGQSFPDADKLEQRDYIVVTPDISAVYSAPCGKSFGPVDDVSWGLPAPPSTTISYNPDNKTATVVVEEEGRWFDAAIAIIQAFMAYPELEELQVHVRMRDDRKTYNVFEYRASGPDLGLWYAHSISDNEGGGYRQLDEAGYMLMRTLEHILAFDRCGHVPAPENIRMPAPAKDGILYYPGKISNKIRRLTVTPSSWGDLAGGLLIQSKHIEYFYCEGVEYSIGDDGTSTIILRDIGEHAYINAGIAVHKKADVCEIVTLENSGFVALAHTAIQNGCEVVNFYVGWAAARLKDGVLKLDYMTYDVANIGMPTLMAAGFRRFYEVGTDWPEFNLAELVTDKYDMLPVLYEHGGTAERYVFNNLTRKVFRSTIRFGGLLDECPDFLEEMPLWYGGPPDFISVNGVSLSDTASLTKALYEDDNVVVSIAGGEPDGKIVDRIQRLFSALSEYLKSGFGIDATPRETVLSFGPAFVLSLLQNSDKAFSGGVIEARVYDRGEDVFDGDDDTGCKIRAKITWDVDECTIQTESWVVLNTIDLYNKTHFLGDDWKVVGSGDGWLSVAFYCMGEGEDATRPCKTAHVQNPYQINDETVPCGETAPPPEPIEEPTIHRGMRVEYTLTKMDDGSVSVGYTAYDEEDNDITDQITTLQVGDKFMYKGAF